jgi:glycerol-3-phosphate cytidylyltransferase
MSRVGYAPGAFDLFHVGHLRLLQQAKSQCDFLIAGVMSGEVLVTDGGAAPVIPLAERLEIVRNIRCVDAAFPAMTRDMHEIWRVLQFDTLFEGINGSTAPSGNQPDQSFAAVGVDVVYLLEAKSTSSDTLRRSPPRSQPGVRKGPTVDFAASETPLWFE